MIRVAVSVALAEPPRNRLMRPALEGYSEKACHARELPRPGAAVYENDVRFRDKYALPRISRVFTK